MKKGKTHQGGKGSKSADARKFDSFSSCGGVAREASAPKIGGVATGGGSEKHHGAAKAQANVKPPSARANASFSDVGGHPKSTGEY